jgi:hypothetical protein
MNEIYEIIKKECELKLGLHKHPVSISFVQVCDSTKMNRSFVKSSIRTLKKDNKIKYYRGINDLYFYIDKY